MNQRMGGATNSIPWIIAMAVGLGFLLSSIEGLLIGGLLGYLFSQVLYLRGAVSALQAQQPETITPHNTAREADTAASTTKPAESAQDSKQTSRSVTTVPTDTPRTQQEPTAQPAITPAAKPAQAPAEPPLKPWIDKGIAWFKQGNPLARVGIVVLFFGGVFLAKYSADQGLLPLEARFAGLALGAIVLIGLGWRMRSRNAVFSQILQGGGVAGFYLTVFAATSLYGLLPQSAAMGLMLAVAVSAALLAVAQNAQSLAFIGTVGGFLTPVLVSSGGGNHIALFSYFAVLNIGVFVVAWFRAWQGLNLAGFVLTFGITGAFRGLSYSSDQLLGTDLFLLLFFVMYVAVATLFSIRQKPDLKGYVSGSLVFGLPIVVFGLHTSLVSHIEYALAWSALGFGLFYAAIAWALFKTQRDNLRLLCEAFAALAVIFASLAIPLAFDQQTTAAMWAVEGAGLLWIGIRQSRMLARGFGLLLQGAGGAGYLIGLDGLVTTIPVLNSGAIGALMLAGAGLFSGYSLRRNQATLNKNEHVLESVLACWAIGWWVLGGTSEIFRSAGSDFHYAGELLFATISGLLFYALGTRLVWPLFNQAAITLMGLTLTFGTIAAMNFGHPFAQYGFFVWPIIFAVAWFLVYRLEAEKTKWFKALHPWPHAVAFWFFALILSWQLSWGVGEITGGIWPLVPWALVPIVMIWLTLRPPLAWPLKTHVNVYRVPISSALAVFALGWVVLANLNHNGDAQLLGYIPLLNPMDITSAMVLVTAGSYWLTLSREQRNQIWPWNPMRLYGGAAGIVFIWLTAALIRALHHGFAVPWDTSAMAQSFLVQSSLSIFWGLLGLTVIVFASRQGLRNVWIAGAGLMGIVVLKLFAVDLTGTDTLARIVSFLAVGGLLLLAGYLSPLPPRSDDEEAAA